MNCRDFQEIADSYLSDELLTETNHDMIRHMESCSACGDLIEARREVRTRLKSAVTRSPEYQISEGFDHRLRTRIRYEFDGQRNAASASWFGLRTLALAAGLLVVAMLSFALVTNFNQNALPSHLVTGFAEDSLINIASGDHQHCAIDHNLEEAPVSLAKADAKYMGLDKVVESEFRTTLADHRLVEAHACKYKDVRFAHFVMQGPSETVSVLVAPAEQSGTTVNEKISEYASEKYEVTSFGVKENRVFVISDLKNDRNRKAAESLVDPFEKHFSGEESIQTAMFTTLTPGYASFLGK